MPRFSFSVGVCVLVYDIELVVLTDCESCTRPISTNLVSMEAGDLWANAWDVFHRKPSRGGRGRRAAVDCVVCFGCGGLCRVLCFSNYIIFLELTRPAASMIPSLASFTSLLLPGAFRDTSFN